MTGMCGARHLTRLEGAAVATQLIMVGLVSLI
jgi:hypothetical protein